MPTAAGRTQVSYTDKAAPVASNGAGAEGPPEAAQSIDIDVESAV
jgi:hypothetical protein